MTGVVRVRVPATSANLGPAFDCAGLALACHDVLEFSLIERGSTKIVVRGEGAGTLAGDESHLVARAFRAGCAELGWDAPGLRIEADNGIPQGRGMGSSAAAVVAGLLAAWSLCPDVDAIDGDAVLRLADALEGHPDNVAPCLLGGATLSWSTAGGARADRLDVSDELLAVVLVPEGVLPTHVARTLLPESVPHGDAAFNAGRAALLVHALTREPGLLLEATEDRLHQRQRAAAMPGSLALIDRLRDAGHAAVVSGAGPSVLVLTRRHPDDPPGDPAAAVRVREVGALVPAGWRMLPLPIDPAGARVDRPVRQVSSR
ncbi:homoserine kinase [Blastococcus sp. BMG 814]|uniref:Homoserine kinase n=1 Tax=Blastococcus carthaginiensis TaxID=3050034 RepID=A0ABT9IHM7_9ACTN|nr:homoserine kinase [Blastococcus carthaginiensis]MDP5185089.1 homoserine kinase [Blastococcus carthaginiensis]